MATNTQNTQTQPNQPAVTPPENTSVVVVAPGMVGIEVQPGQTIELQGFQFDEATFTAQGDALLISLPGQEPIVLENFISAAQSNAGVTVALPNGVEIMGDGLLVQLVEAPATIQPAAGPISQVGGEGGFTPGIAALDTYAAGNPISEVINPFGLQGPGFETPEEDLPIDTTQAPDVNVPPVVYSPTLLTLDEDAPRTAVGVQQPTDADGDALSVTLTSVPANGTLFLGTTALHAGDVITAADLANITFQPNADWNGNTGFGYSVTDGIHAPVTGVVDIVVTPVNDAPVAQNVTATTDENTPVTGQLLASDVDGDALTYSVVSGPANGSVSVNASTGSFTFTPDSSFDDLGAGDSRDVTFTYRAFDGTAYSDVKTVTITVTGVNDAPVAQNVTATTDENTPVTGQLLASDVDGDPLTYSVVSGPANGSVSVNASTGSFTFTPDSSFDDLGAGDSRDVTFTYRAFDGTAYSDVKTVTITVTGVNDAPVAQNVTATTDENTPVTGQLLASDVDGDPLTYSVVSGPANGSVSVNASTDSFTFTPDSSFDDLGAGDSRDVTFTYRAFDGTAYSDVKTVTITVTGVNDAPVAQNVTATTDENTPVTGQLLASDVDGDPLTYSVVAGPANGSVSVNASTGSFTFTPDSSFDDLGAGDSRDVTFTYRAFDGTAYSDVKTVTITVTGVNDAPVAQNVTATTDENTPVTGQLLASDVDGDPLTYSVVAGPANGSVSVNASTGSFTFTPDSSFDDLGAGDSRDVTFTYRAFDGTAYSDVKTVTITVTGVNDAPVAQNVTATTDENTPVTGQLLASDVDGDPLTYSVVAGPANGSVSVNASTGSFTFTPDSSFDDLGAGDSRDVTFTYRAFDGTAYSDVKTVTITVTGVNDAPVAQNVTATTDENTPVTGQLLASDVDGDPLTYSVVSGPANGSVSVNASTGSFTFTPDSSFDDLGAGDSRDVTFTYRAFDGTAYSDVKTVTITVTGVNDAPVANDDLAATYDGVPVTVDVLRNDTDVDGDSLHITSAQLDPAYAGRGTVSFDAAGNITFTPNAGQIGRVTITYGISDGNGGTDTATLTVNVLPGDPVLGGVGQAPCGPYTYLDQLGSVVDTRVAGNLTVTDPNGSLLAGAAVSITAGIKTGDALYLGGGYTITAGKIDGTNINITLSGDEITLSGNDDLATYQNVLRNIMFTNSDDMPLSGGHRTVEISVTDTDGGTDTLTTDVLATTRSYFGSNGDDVLTSTAGSDYIEGGNGNDDITGYAGDDVILGGDGNDRIYAQAGDDRIFGGTGNDELYGDAGDDCLHGGDGDDLLSGGSGNNLLDGGAGADTLLGGGDNDVIIFDSNDKLINGYAGLDTLRVLEAAVIDTSMKAEGGTSSTRLIESVRHFDLKNGVQDQITTRFDDIFLNTSNKAMFITGDFGDNLTLTDGTMTRMADVTQTLNHESYDMAHFQVTRGSDVVDLYVQLGLDVNGAQVA